MDHISMHTYHLHVHLIAAFFFQNVLQCNESPCFLLYSLRKTNTHTLTHTHTEAVLSVINTVVAASVNTDAGPTQCACVPAFCSIETKCDCRNKETWVFLHLHFLVKLNRLNYKTSPSYNRLLFQICLFGKAFSTPLSSLQNAFLIYLKHVF